MSESMTAVAVEPQINLDKVYETSLPHTGDNIVSVLSANGYLYTGSDGYVYKLNSAGDIVKNNSLSGRGNHEVRLAMSSDNTTLYVGTDGYALALDAITLETLWQTSLPKTGDNAVSVLFFKGSVYAGSNGYVFKMDQNGVILKTNSLPDRGNHDVRFAVNTNDRILYVGTDGYSIAMDAIDLITQWQTSLPKTGSNVVNQLFDGKFLFAGSNGYVFKMDTSGNILYTNTLPDRGKHEVRLAISNSHSTLFAGTDGYMIGIDAADLSTIYQTSLPSTGSNVVSLAPDPAGKYIYAGSNGYLYGMLQSDGYIVYRNDLKGRGHHEVRLAITSSNLFLGTDGYALSFVPDYDS